MNIMIIINDPIAKITNKDIDECIYNFLRCLHNDDDMLVYDININKLVITNSSALYDQIKNITMMNYRFIPICNLQLDCNRYISDFATDNSMFYDFNDVKNEIKKCLKYYLQKKYKY